MSLSHKTCATGAAPQLSPREVRSLLCRARLLQRAALDGSNPRPLRGKNLGLVCETPPDEAQALFRSAAEELGAQVALMRPGLSLASAQMEVQNTARMLGRLYEAVECQGLNPEIVQRMGQYAGIPVFNGAATNTHPIERLAGLLGDSTPLADNRRFLLQALLLDAIA
ncbi:ornithine carbamoyltransferase [Variovorax sp. V15]|uniref:ornithine carbamoyltransferase n=1 Tax=Variovorax sp. V15 TaxID=3065952 RepID=UPI0034E8FF4F